MRHPKYCLSVRHNGLVHWAHRGFPLSFPKECDRLCGGTIPIEEAQFSPVAKITCLVCFVRQT